MPPKTYGKKIICFNGSKRYEYNFTDKYEFKAFKEKITTKYPHIKLYVVNKRKATDPPTGLIIPPGHLYCSYCRAPREFNYDSYTGYTKCEICTISTQDFYIKTHNRLWSNQVRTSTSKKKKGRK